MRRLSLLLLLMLSSSCSPNAEWLSVAALVVARDHTDPAKPESVKKYSPSPDNTFVRSFVAPLARRETHTHVSASPSTSGEQQSIRRVSSLRWRRTPSPGPRLRK